MITDSEKDAIRRTWKLVVPIAGTAADLFYKRLFELRPAYADLFPADMTQQKRKLLQMLAFIVKSLDWPESTWKDPVSAEDDLVLVLLALGRRHKDLYRIPAESYAVVGEALIWTLDYGLGKAFDESARSAWLHVYQLVGATMRMGSALTNGKAALGDRAHSESLGEAALQDFQRKFRASGDHYDALEHAWGISMTEAINEPILEGNLADFNLVEVLQVLSLSRQYTRVEVFSDDRHLAGSIFIKSGKVVQASHGALRGKKAFASLIRRPPSRFRVFRINTPALIPEPVGSLSNLLIEAIEEEVSPSPATNARPTQRPRSAPVPAPISQIPARPASIRPQKRTYSGVHALKTTASPHVIAIASPKGGSGKTTVALNLALSLARREHRVILVDGDVNGDVMSSIDGRTAPKAGAFDVIAGGAAPLDALRKTVVPNLEILPAIGQSLPSPEIAFVDYRDRWQLLFSELAQQAEIVIVDTPAGMFGVTYQILSACSHVIGVLQAEVIAHRSFSMFADCLGLLPEPSRPSVLGVFLNMLQLRHSASIDVLARACERLPKEWLFETSIPRNAAFLDATAAGVPLHFYDPKHPPAVSWLFDTLATEVLDRLALAASDAQVRQRRFLA